ncbi:rod shape-determining protein RodA [Candidatus Nucleicultrix amoebiphila]|jgi:rod shape determining protein RodA|uniref:Peptidoglycan glycosyltransferase MrdB n=1 Tax=Candidatus Nucleicultrix amoebiphila FS5 TaxID=1414854 RepID=A0A1W6N5F9_9PROT|nr:rod shape-determining protein RodA [Candidatus Nucleicultrix amoebiphila]ARN85094.1 cell wall shape-determining protein [Candidatus Nucleicultrix amoebiphila FS5]
MQLVLSFFQRLSKINWFILIILSLIASIGLVTLYSAADGHFSPWASKQLLRFIAGLGVLVVLGVVDIRFWLAQSYTLYFISLFLLIVVELMGHVGKGGQRWIDLYIFTLQPSEIMKISLLMALARYFHNSQPDDMKRLLFLIPPALMILVPAVLVLRQPDLGTMILLVAAGFSIFFVAGLRLWIMVTGGILGLSALPIMWNFLHDYQKDRVLTFLDPERDPLKTGYHILQSKIALGSGGFLGKGFREGSQSHLNFLPEKQTDFIFAMFCEEFGVLGGSFLLSLYIILIIYGYNVSLKSHSPYGRFLGLGLTTLFFLYAFVNTAMVTGLLPVVGIPLPLVSYGGTAMITLMMGLGLLMSIEIHRHVRVSRTSK